MDGDRVINFIAGLLSGVIVGASVMVLLTPRSGSEIRKSVRDKVSELTAMGRQARFEQRRKLQEQYVEAIQIPLPSEKESGA